MTDSRGLHARRFFYMVTNAIKMYGKTVIKSCELFFLNIFVVLGTKLSVFVVSSARVQLLLSDREERDAKSRALSCT